MSIHDSCHMFRLLSLVMPIMIHINPTLRSFWVQTHILFVPILPYIYYLRISDSIEIMQLSIVSLAPHYPGNCRDLNGGFTEFCVPRPGTYPGVMRGDISIKRAGNLQPGMSTYADSDQRHPGLWGFTRKTSPAVLGSTRGCTLDITKYLNPWASPRYPRVVGDRGYNW